MSSVRVRRIGARVVVPSMLLAALGGCLVTGPAAGAAVADGSGSGSVQPPSPSGSFYSNGDGTYVASIGDNTDPNVSGTPWTPPACWMQPYFPQSETWKASDPSGQISDADSFYSWFVGQGAAATSSAAQMTTEFKDIQDKTVPAGWTGPDPIEANDIWWAPDWLDSTTGYACAQGMAAENNLSNGYIGLEPPLQKNQQSPLVGALDVDVLGQIATTKIKLPKVSIITSPPGTPEKSAVVNTPTYVAVEYSGDVNPSKTVYSDGKFGLAPIWASAQATIVSVTVPQSPAYTTTGFGDPGQNCAAVDGEATPACTMTFSAPSGNTPDNLKVTVTWKVTYTFSSGDGATDPVPGARSWSKTEVVTEIQSQT
jgi:enoyl reductase